MPRALVRYQQTGDLHFVTFSCYRRLPHLESASAREVFEHSLETIRLRCKLFVTGYVVVSEHVHLLVSEPLVGTLGASRCSWALSAVHARLGARMSRLPVDPRRRDFSFSCLPLTAARAPAAKLSHSRGAPQDLSRAHPVDIALNPSSHSQNSFPPDGRYYAHLAHNRSVAQLLHKKADPCRSIADRTPPLVTSSPRSLVPCFLISVL